MDPSTAEAIQKVEQNLKFMIVRMETVERMSIGMMHILKHKHLIKRIEYKGLKKFVATGNSTELIVDTESAVNGHISSEEDKNDN